MNPDWTAETRRVRRFTLSGGVATALHWSAMVALIDAGGGAYFATALGALFGAVCNYLLQFRLTYRGRASHRRAMPAYLLVCAAGWLLNLLLFGSLTYAGGGPMLSQILTTAGVAIANYLIYSKWVFHESR